MDWSHKTPELPYRQPTPELGLSLFGDSLIFQISFPFNWSILCTMWGGLSKGWWRPALMEKGRGAIWGYKYPNAQRDRAPRGCYVN